MENSMADFKAGDRVRAKAAIFEPADEHHPGGYCCAKGDLLIVRRVRDWGHWPLSVSHEDRTDGVTFAVGPNEVEPDSDGVVSGDGRAD
jgi:hypothetical protein